MATSAWAPPGCKTVFRICLPRRRSTEWRTSGSPLISNQVIFGQKPEQ